MPSRGARLLVLLLRSTQCHAFFEASRESAGGVIEVDAESWADTVVASEKPAFVMWYSPTRGTASESVHSYRCLTSRGPHLTPSPRRRRCPHCRRFGPHYATCAEAHAGPRYFRIDADDNEALADEHSVSKLPSFMLYKNGELASTFEGRPDESKLLAWARSEAPPFSVRDL